MSTQPQHQNAETPQAAARARGEIVASNVDRLAIAPREKIVAKAFRRMGEGITAARSRARRFWYYHGEVIKFGLVATAVVGAGGWTIHNVGETDARHTKADIVALQRIIDNNPDLATGDHYSLSTSKIGVHVTYKSPWFGGTVTRDDTFSVADIATFDAQGRDAGCVTFENYSGGGHVPVCPTKPRKAPRPSMPGFGNSVP